MSPALCLAVLCLRVTSAAPIFDSSFDAQWYMWKMKHGRTYSPSEEEQRRVIWKKNMKMIQLHNSEYLEGKHGFTMEINTSGDMNTEELRVLKNAFQNWKHRDEVVQETQGKKVPRSVGWREESYRTPVKDQEGPSVYDHWCSAANCTRYVLIPENEDALKRAVAMERLTSAAIGGLWGSFCFYKGGNYYDPNCNRTLTCLFS